MAYVFLSYDHQDVAFARPIATALEKAGHTVWYDRHIHGGAQYSRQIEKALDEADAVIVLWSPRSIDSAWVRDEAAEGRDREKLVPLSLEGVTAPIGFRQFQTIQLGEWSGRGKPPHLADLLQAIESQAQITGSAGVSATETPVVTRTESAHAGASRRTVLVSVVAALILAIVGFGAWKMFDSKGLPVVEVAAADSSPASQAAANDLFVKLGSLAQIGQGKWKLVDAETRPPRADLRFKTANTGTIASPRANLVLLDGKDESLLWSREFHFPAGGEADLKQQMSFTAGRVLGCALETLSAGGLRRDLFKIFLTACAEMAETSMDNPEQIVRPLRTIVEAKPGFQPAWGRLIYSQMNQIDVSGFAAGDTAREIGVLKADIARAERVAPELPELKLAEAKLLPPTEYAKIGALIDDAARSAPDKAEVLSDRLANLTSVGRMFEAANVARQLAAANPLSPASTTQMIMTLAYAGQIDQARAELARAEQLWKGTDALRDAQWSFHLRFGDPQAAKRYASFGGEGLDLYLNARSDPSPANVEKLLAQMRPMEGRVETGGYGFAIQALAEFDKTDELYRWIAKTPAEYVAMNSYLLFRPAFDDLRRDPRFMSVAKRIGLLDYWRMSGHWPDFCNEPGLSYNCKSEAAKYAA